MPDTKQEAQTEKTGKKKSYRGKFLLKLAICGLALVVLLSIVERQVQIAEKRERLAQLETQLEDQKQKNQELKKSLEDEDGLRDYAEKRARQEMDYAKSNERVYIFDAGD